jgi:hypothetical protein
MPPYPSCVALAPVPVRSASCHASLRPVVPPARRRPCLRRVHCTAPNLGLLRGPSPRPSAQPDQVVSAFVTFATAEARYKAMEALPRSHLRQLRLPPAKRFGNGGRGRCGGPV